MSDIQHYIGGKRVDGSSGRWGDVYNPATGEKIRRVALATAGEVDRAVQAAAAAFPGWAATPPLTRARILFKFLELLGREGDAIAAGHHRRARQGLLRRARARSRAAPKSSSSPAASRIC